MKARVLPDSAHSATSLASARVSLSDPHTDPAVQRTYLAYERTLMAWTRTAASLISFGFTIYKFFDEFGAKRTKAGPLGYTTFAALMITAGLLSLLLATLQHRRETRALEQQFHLRSRYMAPLLAGLISCLGILGLAAVFLRQ